MCCCTRRTIHIQSCSVDQIRAPGCGALKDGKALVEAIEAVVGWGASCRVVSKLKAPRFQRLNPLHEDPGFKRWFQPGACTPTPWRRATKPPGSKSRRVSKRASELFPPGSGSQKRTKSTLVIRNQSWKNSIEPRLHKQQSTQQNAFRYNHKCTTNYTTNTTLLHPPTVFADKKTI